jgi:hypothetical protein
VQTKATDESVVNVPNAPDICALVANNSFPDDVRVLKLFIAYTNVEGMAVNICVYMKAGDVPTTSLKPFSHLGNPMATDGVKIIFKFVVSYVMC